MKAQIERLRVYGMHGEGGTCPLERSVLMQAQATGQACDSPASQPDRRLCVRLGIDPNERRGHLTHMFVVFASFASSNL